MTGKIIAIEGTDCSGKETQTKLLKQKLKKEGYKVVSFSFPMYDTPTGEIIGACLLGKPEMCSNLLKTNHSFFKEGGGSIDALSAICYYAADRRYNLPKIKSYLKKGYIILLDRYVPSNMAHRGGLIKNATERQKMYEKIAMLEYDILELPKPDQIIFLYLPSKYAQILKENRKEAPDEAEKNLKYLKSGEKAYLELAKKYHYDTVKCVKNGRIKTPEEISIELYNLLKL